MLKVLLLLSVFLSGPALVVAKAQTPFQSKISKILHIFTKKAVKSQAAPAKQCVLATKDIALMLKYGISDVSNTQEILSCVNYDVPRVSSKEYSSFLKADKVLLSKRISSRVSSVASTILGLDSRYYLLGFSARRKLRSFVSSKEDADLDSSLAKLYFIDGLVKSLPILPPQHSATVTSHFGARKLSARKASFHKGLDMTSCKRNVHAAASGVVLSCAWASGYGNLIVIDHGGVKTKYAHLSRFYVRPGQSVAQGQKIALEGATGRARGRHLHFEVLLLGRHVDPMDFLACSMRPAQLIASQAVLARQKSRVAQTTFFAQAVNSSPKRRKIVLSSSLARKKPSTKLSRTVKFPAIKVKNLPKTRLVFRGDMETIRSRPFLGISLLASMHQSQMLSQF